ncbi:DUF411 domain-containing protein [Acidiphilium sp. PA]|uniref:DUF411 domain-containing protein n=1 Tax=Acidiphilium sp. PA TaxID=2871705 RepID=UPI002242E267|nr:DUF411 domain-containing protein [Acidiphilium sp. PA]MCW8308047.1 DUF411 domain-containing protein [Acidiphilium sp. PA]
MKRRTLLNTGIALAVLAPVTAFAAPIEATLYKDPSCSCCEAYAKYLDKNGYKVKVVPSPNLEQITLASGIPQSLVGCHLTRIGDHVFEGHIPAPLIKKFLAEPSSAKGLAIPGMPVGLPGMPAMAGMAASPVAVYLVGTPKPTVFAVVN